MQLYLGSARKYYRSTLKGSKQKHEVLRFSSRRETPRSHVLNVRATQVTMFCTCAMTSRKKSHVSGCRRQAGDVCLRCLMTSLQLIVPSHCKNVSLTCRVCVPGLWSTSNARRSGTFIIIIEPWPHLRRGGH